MSKTNKTGKTIVVSEADKIASEYHKTFVNEKYSKKIGLIAIAVLASVIGINYFNGGSKEEDKPAKTEYVFSHSYDSISAKTNAVHMIDSIEKSKLENAADSTSEANVVDKWILRGLAEDKVNHNYSKNKSKKNYIKPKYSNTKTDNNSHSIDTVFVDRYIDNTKQVKNYSRYYTGINWVDISIKNYLDAGKVRKAAKVALRANDPCVAVKIYEDHNLYGAAARTAKKQAIKEGEIIKTHTGIHKYNYRKSN